MRSQGGWGLGSLNKSLCHSIISFSLMVRNRKTVQWAGIKVRAWSAAAPQNLHTCKKIFKKIHRGKQHHEECLIFIPTRQEESQFGTLSSLCTWHSYHLSINTPLGQSCHFPWCNSSYRLIHAKSLSLARTIHPSSRHIHPAACCRFPFGYLQVLPSQLVENETDLVFLFLFL